MQGNLAPMEQLNTVGHSQFSQQQQHPHQQQQPQQQLPLLDSLPQSSSGLLLNRLTAEQQQHVMSTLHAQQQPGGNGSAEPTPFPGAALPTPAPAGGESQQQGQPQPSPVAAIQQQPASDGPIPIPPPSNANTSLVATLMEEFDVDIDDPLPDLGGGANGDGGGGGGVSAMDLGVHARDVSPAVVPASVTVATTQGPFAAAEAPVVGSSPGGGGAVGSPMRPGSSAAAADSEAARVASLSGWMHGSPVKVASPRGTPAGPTAAVQHISSDVPEAFGALAGTDGGGGGAAGEQGHAQAPSTENNVDPAQ